MENYSNICAKCLYLITLCIICGCTSTKPIQKASDENLKPPEVKKVEVPKTQKEKLLAKLKELQDVKPDVYRISPGDKFNVFVYDNQELNTMGCFVKTDGNASIKLIGEVKLEGMTLEEAKKTVEKKMSKYVRYPKVSLIPYKLNVNHFTIIGKVGKGGSYTFETGIKISDTIAMAGGLRTGQFHGTTVELADLQNAYISRDGNKLPVNFIKVIREGNKLHDIPIKNGDYIYIPSSMNQEIFVLGEVNSPAYLGYKENLTLLHAITYAAGLKETCGNTAIILRNGLVNTKPIEVNIEKILEGKTRDFILKPNDIVYLKPSGLEGWNRIIRAILPTMNALQTTLNLKDSIFPIKGGFIPQGGWKEMPEDATNINIQNF